MEQAKDILKNQKTIGKNKYQVLKTYDFKNMTTEEMVKFREERKMSVAEALDSIDQYEKKFELTDYQKEIQKEYFNKIINPKESKGKKLSAEMLYKAFTFYYEKMYFKKYDTSKNSDSLENLKTLIFYFTRDKRFFNQKNLIEETKVNEVIKKSIPSFEKGFLIVGGYGTGKTSSMSVFEAVFKELKKKGYDTPVFKSYTSKKVSEMYEVLEKESEKRDFWSSMKRGRLFFDDLKSEDKASNYGIKNVMKEVLEKREYMIDFISCNYSDQKINDVSEALIEIGEKYGSRVFDRIFSKWNIIEFKGKSYRGD